MSRARLLALAAVFASAAFLGTFTSGDRTTTDAIDRAASASASSADGAIAHNRAERPAITAVDPGRAPVLARSESRQPLRVLFIALTAVALACGAIGRRGRSLGPVLELAIRAQSAIYGPAPGRRAPPRALAV